MKKIVFFSHICQESVMSGAETTMFQLLEKMSENHRCFCVLPQDGILAKRVAQLDIPIIFCHYPAIWSVKDPTADFHIELSHVRSQGVDKSIQRLLQDLRPDYIVVNTSVNLLPAIVAKEEGIPVIWFLQEHVPESIYKERWISFVEKQTPVLVGISKSVLEPFRLRKYPQNKMQCLYPYWNDSTYNNFQIDKMRRQLRRKFGISTADLVVGTISIKLTIQKGVWHLIRAMAPMMLQIPSIHLIIRATKPINKKQPYLRQIRDFIAKHRLQHRIHWIPYVADIAQVYPALDLVVVPSIEPEGFGLTALEGMGYGKPVVVYPSGGLKEILFSTFNQEYVAKHLNPQALRRVIRPLIYSSLLREQVGERNKQQAKIQFGIDMYTQRYQILEQKLGWKTEGK